VEADHALVRRHLQAMLAEAEAQGIPADVLGRVALQEIVALWKRSRSWQDIAAELEFTARSLDPDADFEFMRP
jgi:hypothetical protein